MPGRAVLEVEVKLRLRDGRAVDALVDRLLALGAQALPAEVQEDWFFRHPGREFARTDEALRLRRVGDSLELTYKGPKQGGAAKARTEYTVPVASDPTPLLEALGFARAARLAKRRRPFRLGAVHIALDHLAGLGDFVEVEVVGPDQAAAETQVERALDQLGLAQEPRVASSYLELALAKGLAQFRVP